MELLEDVTYPRPLAELLEVALPGVRAAATRGCLITSSSPKSVARDLYERSMTFTEYVSFYTPGPGRGHRAALPGRRVQGAAADRAGGRPDRAVADLIAWLGELVRQVDSSLLEEWERLRNPETAAPAEVAAALDDRTPPVTSNLRAFRVLVRNALFRRVELAARRRWDELGELDHEAGWPASAWQDALEPYFDEHAAIQTGANARGPALLMIDETATAGRRVDRPPDHRRPGRSPGLGASPPRSTSTAATPRARRSSASSRWVASTPGSPLVSRDGGSPPPRRARRA